METFQVESFVGRGAQHVVGRLKNGQLIKYPHPKGQKWDKSTRQTAEGDLNIHKTYNNPIPETSVVQEPTIDTGTSIIRCPYALLTEEVRGRIFRETDLQDEGIRSQITELVEKSFRIRRTRDCAIDFLGGEALQQFFHYLFKETRPGQLGAYNIMVDDREKLRLIDTNLLDPKRSPHLFKWFVNSSVDLQHTLLAELLGERDRIQECLEHNRSQTVTKTAQKMYRLSRRIEARRNARTLADKG